jgi:hypothetical protein
LQPERELVERQRRADAVDERGEPREDPATDAHLHQPEIADQQQHDYPEHEVVDVRRPDVDVVEGAPIVADRVHDDACDRERDEEPDRGEKQPFPPRIAEVVAVEVPDAARLARGVGRWLLRRRQRFFDGGPEEPSKYPHGNSGLRIGS